MLKVFFEIISQSLEFYLISYPVLLAGAYLEPNRTSTMKRFCENAPS